MADQATDAPAIVMHGAMRLPAVEVNSYNIETKDDDGYVGDRASKGAFRAILENWRKELRRIEIGRASCRERVWNGGVRESSMRKKRGPGGKGTLSQLRRRGSGGLLACPG